jgi:hypothetical protein
VEDLERDRAVVAEVAGEIHRGHAAAAEQRARWELVGDGEGVRWPEIDEDLSARGFFVGAPAPRPRARSS